MADATTENIGIKPSDTVISVRTEPMKVEVDTKKLPVASTFSKQQEIIAGYLNKIAGLFKHKEKSTQQDNFILSADGRKRYRLQINRPIAGGMSELYLASDGTSQGKEHSLNLVVIKTPAIKDITGGEDPQFYIDSFINEAHTMAMIDHPNVMKVSDFDWGVFPDGTRRPFYAMRYLKKEDAVSVDKIVDQEGKMEVDECIKLAKDMGSAIDEYAPENNVPRQIRLEASEYLDYLMNQKPSESDETAPGDYKGIHNDIKMGNIIKNKHTGNYVLTDFGSFVFTGDKDRPFLTGTPTHMSPEMSLGDPVDKKSDIYCLGITLFEVLTGELPFPQQHDALSTILYMLNNDFDKQPIIDLYPDNPRAQRIMIDFFNRVLSKDKKDRPQSGKEFSDKFEDTVKRVKDSANLPPRIKLV